VDVAADGMVVSPQAFALLAGSTWKGVIDATVVPVDYTFCALPHA
jgi:hypothetical protein